MSEVFLPRFGGEGDGDGAVGLKAVAEGEGTMGEMDVAVGEMGLSRRFGGDFGTMVALEDCIDSNALMRAFTAEDAIAAAEKEEGADEREGPDGGAGEQSTSRERQPRMVLTPNPHARERLGKCRGGWKRRHRRPDAPIDPEAPSSMAVPGLSSEDARPSFPSCSDSLTNIPLASQPSPRYGCRSPGHRRAAPRRHCRLRLDIR